MPRTVRWTAGLVLATTLVCGTACDSDSAPRKPAATPPGSVQAPAAPAEALPSASTSTASPSVSSSSSGVPSNPADAALYSYRQMWAVMVQASVTPDPENPRLAEFATGNALRDLKLSLLVDQRNGWTSKGTLHFAPRVVSASGTEAQVEDCADDSEWLKYNVGGNLTAPAPGGKRHVEAKVTRVGEAWKVSELSVHEIGTCS